jgi:alkylhydroperoxidase family enzyme
MTRIRFFVPLALLVVCALPVVAEDKPAENASDRPKDVPATREEVKEALNRLRDREPRLPLPPPTEEELKAARERAAAGGGGSGGGLGGGLVNNGRMRALHLPEELRTNAGFRPQGNPRERDPNQIFDYAFSTELFWIVSRVNNCHYCLGHQEQKLLSAGLDDDRIAALDGDWGQFTPAEQAAFAFTRKLTFEPHLIGDEDIDRLKLHYNDVQVFEILSLVSRYNSTNRWTDSLGIPQEAHRDFKTPTSAKYLRLVTSVAPVDPAKPKGTSAPAMMAERPSLESRGEVEAALARCQKRTPRLPLPEETTARASLTNGAPDGDLPQWVRLMLSNSRSGPGSVASYRTLEEKGRLSPKMRSQIAWIAARHDRAWYALGQARQRLRALGLNDTEIFALDNPNEGFSPAEQQVFKFARKLTAAPQLIVDSDISRLREHFTDSEVAEIVHRVTTAAYFDRLTESAGLKLE